MSFFYSPLAEYRAKRITQILAHTGQHNVMAQRNGRVMVNCSGHLHLFDLDDQRNLVLLDSADILKPKPVVEIVG